jgi:WD40-like Beta Propeller Repeat
MHLSNLSPCLRRGMLSLPLLGLLTATGVVQAQTAQESFGRTRIQYKNFDWQLLSTANFNVYYYGGGEAMARRAAEYSEQELQRITSLIGYYPYSKTTVMLYNSVGDLRQSNVGLNDDKYSMGGETSLSRATKVQLAFQGQQTLFKRDLSYQVTKVLLNDMMYGGSLKEVIQSSYLLQLPDWFVGGASAYAAEGWSVEMDDYMRDMTQKVEKDKAAQFFLRNPELAGQSLWNYIAERYGYTSVQNILNLTRITRDVETGISSSLNVPYKQFLRDWLAYYRQLNSQPETALQHPDEQRQLMSRNRRSLTFNEPVISPNGQLLAYTTTDRGRYHVIVANVDGSGKHIVYSGGYKSPDQEVDRRLPVLAWRNNAQLAVAEEARGKMVLRLRSANSGPFGAIVRLKESLPFIGDRGSSLFNPYSQVLSMGYSPDGKALAFSGVRNGQADLYLLRAGTRQPERLTNDVFDDVQPVFMPDGQSLIFSSNRWLDSAGTAKGNFKGVVNNYDLFRYRLDGSPQPVEQLVATISNETRPRVLSQNEVLFLSEESGVRSVYRYNLTTRQRSPVTSFLNNLKSFDYSPTTGALGFVAADRAREFVYSYPKYELSETLTLTKTARQEILEDRSAAASRPKPKAAAQPQQPAPGGSNLAGGIQQISPPKRQDPNQGVNVSDYQFEEDAPRIQRQRRTAATVVQKPAAVTPGIAGPIRYDTRFSLDNVVSTIYTDPLLGFGFIGQATMSDMFEDHRIRAGIFALTDLRTSNMFAEYTNLKHRYDWSIGFQKQSYYVANEVSGNLYMGRYEVTPGISYPLSHNISVRGNLRYVNALYSNLDDLGTSDRRDHFLGGSGELVFDNSIATGVNMLEGTRMKVGVLKLNQMKDSKEDFGKIYVDVRHYQKVHRQIIWANRASYGQFFGNSPKVFRLGGMDNWLNQRTDDGREVAPVNGASPADFFYQQFVTNLRGFNYNARSGPKYVLFNSELRVPIIQYLSRKPIYSGFFRNLQLTGFADAGTAYSGANPFNFNNSVNTVPFGGNGNAFEGTVTNFQNPFLIGYGAGMRTTLLGFYGKLDVAWARENGQEKGPKFYLSLGYDF